MTTETGENIMTAAAGNTEPIVSGSPFSMGVSVKKAWDIFAKRPLPFVGFYCIAVVPHLLSLFLARPFPQAIRPLRHFGNFAYYAISLGCTAAVVADILSGKTVRFLNAAIRSIQSTPLFILLVAARRIEAGLWNSLHPPIKTGEFNYLFVIVAILAITWIADIDIPLRLFVVVPTAVLERTGIVASIKRSVSLTKGNRTNLFGFGIVYVLFSMIVRAICVFMIQDSLLRASVVYFVFMLPEAYFCVVMAVAYHDLKAAREGPGGSGLINVFD